MRREFTYGPFRSRRLGLSLGINILPQHIVCTYNCVYCELGNKAKESVVSPEYEVVLPVTPQFRKELISHSKSFPTLESMSFSGYYGEPTLNKYLPQFFEVAYQVRESKSWSTKKPLLTLFTNSSTLHKRKVRKTVKKFDLILAKLDCATEEDFRRTNQPHMQVPSIKEIISSLAQLKTEMNHNNQLAIQCLIYQSNRKEFKSNNNQRNIELLAEAIKTINPDIVQLYSIARIPAHYYVYAIDEKRKQEIVRIFKSIVDNESVKICYY
ncbi:MAG: hypothetical protein BAJALOKI1v1_290019 [Promethearchaeota archaeon]|nr:MAG: hypothetical protein BAJALOKI1v1_290019 [Candidatus Lokiarchaeota archaeon]